METRQIVRTFMNKAFEDEGFDDEVQDDASLVDLGILDSLTTLQLIDFFDEAFGIVPAEDEFDPENFDSVLAIIAFIEKKLG
ncbi:acyl carrier protein [Desulfonema magnum]|uniref:Acyl carrier protein n=1 Tax=Desulfonema magnum TaxID=45655 RepID=A0A975BQH9_9BACT|nr:acyl carrier protein [Desulfonema magnum]QTA90004.1 Putative acyl carrier protein [Desulfonema magnum]